jgi:hypothetical protein
LSVTDIALYFVVINPSENKVTTFWFCNIEFIWSADSIPFWCCNLSEK